MASRDPPMPGNAGQQEQTAHRLGRVAAAPIIGGDPIAELGTAVLVTRQGDGHTAYTSDNECIKRLVDDYLIDGKVPKDGTTCKE